MLSDTGDQVVCTVDQTDGHSKPHHTTSRAGVEWDSLGPHAILLKPPSGPTGSVMFLHGLIGSAKAVCKSRPPYLWQLCHCVWTVLECDYYIKQ